MPYTFKQCGKFFLNANKGLSVPKDFRKYCKGVTKPILKKKR